MKHVNYTGLLTDRPSLKRFLTGLGVSPSVADVKAGLFAASAATLEGPLDNAHAYYVPGRVEVLGKHTDYAGGSTIVAAVERAICMTAVARDDSQITIRDAVRDETVRFTMEPELVPEKDRWSNYPMTVARRIARNFPGAARGADIAFSSDLPAAAGMSSSSAFMVATFHALADVNDIWHHERFPAELNNPVRLAGYLGTIENGQSYGALEGDRGVGTFGGSEDHTAILCSRAGYVTQFAYSPVKFEQAIAFPPGYSFAIASSGVVAEKTGAARVKYNRASQLVAELMDVWRKASGRDDPHLKAAIDSAPGAPDRLRKLVAAEAGPDRDALSNRLEHFLVENEEVVSNASEAMLSGDIESFGKWVDRSQDAAERLLGTQTPETICLAAEARRLGAAAASSFGGGFGGSIWALVKTADSAQFLSAWQEAYERQFPEPAARSEFFTTSPGPPMFRLTQVGATPPF